MTIQPSSTGLRSAIDSGNFETARSILGHRIPDTGIPTVDINHISDNEALRTALNYTLASGPDHGNRQARYEIAYEILSIRDLRNNPVIDPNVRNFGGGTSFSWLQDAARDGHFLAPHARTLSQRILNLRNSDGTRVFDVDADTSTTGLLVAAVLQKDAFVVNELADLRNANGTHAININKIFSYSVIGRGWSQLTALDVAMMGSYWYDAHANLAPGVAHPFQEIIDVLRQYGAKTYAEIQAEIAPAQEVRRVPIAVTPAREVRRDEAPVAAALAREVPRDADIRRFVQDPQNVHGTEIETAVDRSIDSLCKKYFPEHYFTNPHRSWKSHYKDRFTVTLLDIEAHINKSARRDKATISSGFQYITSVSFSEHSATYLSLEEILCLVWIAASDESAPSPSNPHLDPQALTNLRREAILDGIYNAETTYGTSRSCVGGYRNQLLMALSQAHECVNIVLLETGVFAMAIDSLNFWITRDIQRLDLRQQKAILRSWSTIEAEDQENPAYQFQSNPAHRNKMLQLLNTNYRLSAKHYEDITVQWYSLSKPSLHPQLNSLIDRIAAIFVQDQASIEAGLARTIQQFSESSIVDSRSFEEDYQSLNREYKYYESIRGCWQNLSQLSIDHPSNLPLKALVKEVDTVIRQKIHSPDSLRDLFEDLKLEVNKKTGKINRSIKLEIAVSCLKDISMICLPIIGWLALLYRFCYEKKVFFSNPRALYNQIHKLS